MCLLPVRHLTSFLFQTIIMAKAFNCGVKPISFSQSFVSNSTASRRPALNCTQNWFLKFRDSLNIPGRKLTVSFTFRSVYWILPNLQGFKVKGFQIVFDLHSEHFSIILTVICHLHIDFRRQDSMYTSFLRRQFLNCKGKDALPRHIRHMCIQTF